MFYNYFMDAGLVAGTSVVSEEWLMRKSMGPIYTRKTSDGYYEKVLWDAYYNIMTVPVILHTSN